MTIKHISLKTIALFAFCLWIAPRQTLAVNRLTGLGNFVKRHPTLPATHTLFKATYVTARGSINHMPYGGLTRASFTMPNTTSYTCFYHRKNRYSNVNRQNRYRNVSADSGKLQGIAFLEKIEKMLQIAKVHLDVAKGKSCIVFMGTTGVGKSLLLNAIYNGSHTIKAVKQDVEYSFSSPSDGDVHLIATKEVLINDQILFNTGAGNRSVTFFPEAVDFDGQVLVDCPGLGDTRGGIQDLVNSIAIGNILHKASRVRLCFLLSQDQIMDKTGRKVATKELLDVLLRLCKTKNNEEIGDDRFKKVQIVVTHLEGDKRKGDLQHTLAGMLQKLLSKDKHAAITQMVENLLLVDPADRLSQFKDVKRSWLQSSSNDQTTVAALKSKLFDEEDGRWFLPSDFVGPMTEDAACELINIYQLIGDEAREALYNDDNYEEKVAELLDILKKIQEYEFEGVKGDNYIADINLALTAKRKRVATEEKIKELSKVTEELEKKAKGKTFFKTAKIFFKNGRQLIYKWADGVCSFLMKSWMLLKRKCSTKTRQ